MSPIAAGLVAALPLAGIFIAYILLRGKALAAFFREQDENLAKIPQTTFRWMLLAGFAGAAFLFGFLAGLAYAWLGMPAYLYLAAGATLLFSLLAMISRQPLPGDKIAWNIAVGGTLGLLMPLLAG